MTLFTAGQIVRAAQSSQALVAGARYRIVDVHERYTAFGTFVTYVVTPVESLVTAGITMVADHYLIPVANGHLLLPAVPATGGARLLDVTVNDRDASLVDVARIACIQRDGRVL